MKVAIYCRLSDEDKNKKNKEVDSESIQNQKSMLISYAMQKQWEIYNIYSDDDFKGSDRNRPDFNRLLKEAEERKFDIILCKTQARFTRELELVEKYIHGLFPIWGIRFVSIVDNADTANKGNKKARQINGLINEWYLEELSDNIKGVFRDKKINGQHVGSFAVYGYTRDPENKGKLIVDLEASRVVKEIFNLYMQGYGKTHIARILNEKGIPNPSEYKRQQGFKYKNSHHKNRTNGTFWTYSSICTVIKNEMYIGNLVQGKYQTVSYKSDKKISIPKENWIVVKNNHEPIIDINLWNKVQAMSKDRAKPFDTGKVGLFAKKVKCLECGYNLKSTLKHGGIRYLRCESRYTHREVCSGAMISVDRLERFVLAELQILIDKYADKNYIAQRVTFNNKLDEQKEDLQADIETYKKKIEICSNGIKSLYVDKTKGLIDDGEFVDLSKNFHKDKKLYLSLISEIEEKLIALDNKRQHTENIYQFIEQFTNIEKLNRNIVLELIDYIEVGHRYEKSKDRPVKIHWNF